MINKYLVNCVTKENKTKIKKKNERKITNRPH